MYRIISKIVVMLLNLAIIGSLAIYSVSAVNAAIHPQARYGEVQSAERGSVNQEAQETLLLTQDDSADHHDHPDMKKKRSCCEDYCVVSGIPCSASLLSYPKIMSLHVVPDDPRALGEVPVFHRPPKI